MLCARANGLWNITHRLAKSQASLVLLAVPPSVSMQAGTAAIIAGNRVLNSLTLYSRETEICTLHARHVWATSVDMQAELELHRAAAILPCVALGGAPAH